MSYREWIEPIWYDCWDCQTQCHGDADCDGYVDPNDLVIITRALQSGIYDPCADFNRDGLVNLIDLSILQLYFGTRPPADCALREQYWNVVADDFRCLLGTMPITSVHWWGSYFGWVTPGEMPNVLPIGWKICFWSNVPATPGVDPGFSYPKKLLWQIEVDANRVTVEEVGTDSYHGYYPEDVCYQYNLDLEPNEWFRQYKYSIQTKDDVFWISIAAVYDPNPPEPQPLQYPWGWKTRAWSWMDAAVRFWLDEAPEPDLTLNPSYNGIAPIIDPLYGESMDMAFELDTDPNYIKWEQHYTGIRDWEHYEDEPSTGTVARWTEVETKWSQKPNLSPMGMDVDATMEMSPMPLWPPQILADDFGCVETGPITDIHIWGSWLYDEMPMDPHNVEFTLSIYSDNPHGVNGWSEPNKPLWRMDFPAGAFMAEPVWQGPEGYFNPCQFWYQPQNHFMAWKYNFYIDEANAFIQKGTEDEPVIYWLAVQARPMPFGPVPIRFGWKTSIEPWNDDAVFAVGEFGQPYPGEPWIELRHPETMESLDLAFEITTGKYYEEVEVERRVADDWLCDNNTPVLAVVWWGSYLGYGFEPCSGQFMPLPVKPDFFELSIWTDVPANPGDPEPYSHPGEKIWESRAYDYDEVFVGYDKDPRNIIGPPREPVFRYSVNLLPEDLFYQKEPNTVYWLSVVAVYDDATPNYAWGWTNHKHAFNDDAAAWEMDPAGGAWNWVPLKDQIGETEDMSFMLFTEPGCFPPHYSTYPDWLTYGKPDCWCAPPDGSGYQCDGDGDGATEGILKRRVYQKDLDMLIVNWTRKIDTADPCADFDHKAEGILKRRVYQKDLDILILNWTKKDSQLPVDCPIPE